MLKKFESLKITEIIDYISGTFIYIMPILLQINKITFGKGENLEKKSHKPGVG